MQTLTGVGIFRDWNNCLALVFDWYKSLASVICLNFFKWKMLSYFEFIFNLLNLAFSVSGLAITYLSLSSSSYSKRIDFDYYVNEPARRFTPKLSQILGKYELIKYGITIALLPSQIRLIVRMCSGWSPKYKSAYSSTLGFCKVYIMVHFYRVKYMDFRLFPVCWQILDFLN